MENEYNAEFKIYELINELRDDVRSIQEDESLNKQEKEFETEYNRFYIKALTDISMNAEKVEFYERTLAELREKCKIKHIFNYLDFENIIAYVGKIQKENRKLRARNEALESLRG